MSPSNRDRQILASLQVDWRRPEVGPGTTGKMLGCERRILPKKTKEQRTCVRCSWLVPSPRYFAKSNRITG